MWALGLYSEAQAWENGTVEGRRQRKPPLGVPLAETWAPLAPVCCCWCKGKGKAPVGWPEYLSPAACLQLIWAQLALGVHSKPGVANSSSGVWTEPANWPSRRLGGHVCSLRNVPEDCTLLRWSQIGYFLAVSCLWVGGGCRYTGRDVCNWWECTFRGMYLVCGEETSFFKVIMGKPLI